MKAQPFRKFSQEEHATWSTLFRNLERCRADQAHPIFVEGVKKLGLDDHGVPDIYELNGRLRSLTSWEGVPVEGLEENQNFFEGLANRQFPIGNFIRDARDVSYTPAPDVFHDLYGHLPFLANEEFAAFCEEFGRRASKLGSDPAAMEAWGRLFWFGVEFCLLETSAGRKIFGGGILSSAGESDYALSAEPTVVPFDITRIFETSYKIDEFQKLLFVLDSPEQLYGSLAGFEQIVTRRKHELAETG